MNILEVQGVNKSYRTKKALQEISFSVEKGGMLGLLGPNGAGKTTLIRIITRINQADSGSILFNGEPLSPKHIQFTGYLPEERGLYKKMEVYEHLMYLGRLKGLSKQETSDAIEYWLQKFDIDTWRKKKIEELSKGMQQKVQFVAAVMNKPHLLILDEPFSGLDPLNTNLIKAEIRRLNQEGTSIIFSTHRMNQVEEICRDIVLINNGKVLIHQHIVELKQNYKQNLFSYEISGDHDLNDILTGYSVQHMEGNRFFIQHNSLTESNHFLTGLIDKGIAVISYSEHLPSLDDIFIRLVEESHE